jgi:DNA-binding transcriptional LysR family regulator
VRPVVLPHTLTEEERAHRVRALADARKADEEARRRAIIEDELRRAGTRLRELKPKLELGLQESARSAVTAGYGVTFISRAAIEADLAAGTLAVARVKGLDPSREISLVRSAGRSPTRAAEAFLSFARERLE